jgi:hypothetical protein
MQSANPNLGLDPLFQQDLRNAYKKEAKEDAKREVKEEAKKEPKKEL